MDIVTRAIAKAQEWSDSARAYSTPYASKLLSQVLDHPGGLDYTVNFVDGVIRPEDPAVVADNLSAISAKDASFLPRHLALLAKGGGRLAPLLPGAATVVAEKMFAALVGDLVVDVTPSKLALRLRSSVPTGLASTSTCLARQSSVMTRRAAG